MAELNWDDLSPSPSPASAAPVADTDWDSLSKAPPTIPAGPGLATRIVNKANVGLSDFLTAPGQLARAGLGALGIDIADPTQAADTITQANRGKEFDPQSAPERYAQSVMEAAGSNAVPLLGTLGAGLHVAAASANPIGILAREAAKDAPGAIATDVLASTGQGVGGQGARDAFPDNPYADTIGQIIGGLAGGLAIPGVIAVKPHWDDLRTSPPEAEGPINTPDVSSVQSVFDSGADKEGVLKAAADAGVAPNEEQLDAAIKYRDAGGKGAKVLSPDAPVAPVEAPPEAVQSSPMSEAPAVKEPLTELPSRVGNINTDKGGFTLEDYPQLVAATENLNLDPQTHVESIKQAAELRDEMSPEELITMDPLRSEQVAHSIALRAQLNDSIAAATKAAADVVDPTTNTTEASKAFDDAMNLAGMTANAVSEGAKFAGRLLNAHGIKVGPDGKYAKVIGDMASGYTAEMRNELAEQVLYLKNNPDIPPEALPNLAKNLLKPYAEDYVAKLWYNFVLSNPKTWVTTMQDNAQQMVQRIAENKAATMAGSMTPEEMNARQYAFNQAISDAGAIFSGDGNPMVRGIKQAFEQGHPITGASRLAVGPVDLGPLEWTSFGPKIITSIDQFYRQMASNMEVAGLATRKAQSEGHTGDALDERVAYLRVNPTPSMAKAADEAAKSSVYAEKLTGLMGLITKAQTRTPDMNIWQRAGRFAAMMAAPFPRVEFNIIKNIVRSSPLGVLDPQTVAAIKMGGPARGVAVARMAIGSAVIGGIATLAESGDLTPQGVKIGGNIYSYDNTRLGTTAKLVADTMADWKSGAMQQEDLAHRLLDISGHTISGMSENTWFADTAKLFSVFQRGREGDQARHDFVKDRVSSLVPAVVNAVDQQTDRTVRDSTGSIVDAVKARIPVLSNTLPAKHDDLGNPMTRTIIPLTGTKVTPVVTDPVATELDRLQQGQSSNLLTQVPRTLRIADRSIPISTEERQALQATAGTETHGLLLKAMTSPSWDTTPDSLKILIIKKIASASKKMSEAPLEVRKINESK